MCVSDVTFFRDMIVRVHNLDNIVECGNSYGMDTTETSKWKLSCNPFAYGHLVSVSRRSIAHYWRLTLCEVDVFGTKIALSTPGLCSVIDAYPVSAARQSGSF